MRSVLLSERAVVFKIVAVPGPPRLEFEASSRILPCLGLGPLARQLPPLGRARCDPEVLMVEMRSEDGRGERLHEGIQDERINVVADGAAVPHRDAGIGRIAVSDTLTRRGVESVPADAPIRV